MKLSASVYKFIFFLTRHLKLRKFLLYQLVIIIIDKSRRGFLHITSSSVFISILSFITVQRNQLIISMLLSTLLNKHLCCVRQRRFNLVSLPAWIMGRVSSKEDFNSWNHWLLKSSSNLCCLLSSHFGGPQY